jgi:hypothetical protein
MSEPADRFLLQAPLLIRRPQSGQFILGEAGSHADRGVMSGYGAAANKADQFTKGKGAWRASRFNRDEEVRAALSPSKQSREMGFSKMVQEEISYHRITRERAAGIKHLEDICG